MTTIISRMTAVAITPVVFFGAFFFLTVATHADARLCRPIISSPAWNGGNSAPGSAMHRMFSADFMRHIGR